MRFVLDPLNLFICLFVFCVFVCLFVCVCVCLCVFVYVCSFVCLLFVCLFVCLLVCFLFSAVSVCVGFESQIGWSMSDYLSACISIVYAPCIIPVFQKRHEIETSSQ